MSVLRRHLRWGVETSLANSRMIAGFWSGGYSGANDPSNATDAVLFGWDSGDRQCAVHA
jgi:hypothetical protein